MNRKQGLCAGVGMVLCALAGAGFEHVRLWLFAPIAEEPVEAEVQAAAPARPRVVTVKDESAERDAAALRKRVADLEQALAERAQAVQQPPKEEPVREERPRRQGWAERMEQLKKENPERYAEMQKRREEFRQNMEQREQDRANFLTAVDEKNMTAAQRENHEKLLATLTRVNELMAQMGDPGAEGNSDARREMGETMGTLHELYGQERTYLLEATAKAVGCQGDDVTAFAEQIQAIIDNTSMMHGGWSHRGPGGPGGAPGAPAGR